MCRVGVTEVVVRTGTRPPAQRPTRARRERPRSVLADVALRMERRALLRVFRRFAQPVKTAVERVAVARAVGAFAAAVRAAVAVGEIGAGRRALGLARVGGHAAVGGAGREDDVAERGAAVATRVAAERSCREAVGLRARACGAVRPVLAARDGSSGLFLGLARRLGEWKVGAEGAAVLDRIVLRVIAGAVLHDEVAVLLTARDRAQAGVECGASFLRIHGRRVAAEGACVGARHPCLLVRAATSRRCAEDHGHPEEGPEGHDCKRGKAGHLKRHAPQEGGKRAEEANRTVAVLAIRGHGAPPLTFRAACPLLRKMHGETWRERGGEGLGGATEKDGAGERIALRQRPCNRSG